MRCRTIASACGPRPAARLRAGALPEPEGNGVRYLRIPLDAL